MVHRTFGSRGSSGRDSIDDLHGTAVDDRFIEAAKAASESLRSAGVRHSLVGGLAVGVRGYPRNTKDVDFLVGEEAFDHHGLIVSPKAGLPIRYRSIDIDWVSMEETDRGAFERYLEIPQEGEVPVIETPGLVLMKMIAGRQKDKADVVELVKAGVDTEEIEEFIGEVRPDLIDDFRRLVFVASNE